MNELLEAKLTISRIRTQLLDLVGELVADDLTDKPYAIQRILMVVGYIDKHDVEVKEIVDTLAIKARLK
ncbi:hypothetical protein QNH48_10190 [Neobacillus sp. YX16]|uniref:hypothetical protein n=1 Tax=Neobacillus sp. YX16 TaxID=3047874 RepID=UPI0024C22ED8|nr:hypothetical protein [Neobacillus sp. YX16]WHZ04958.1 hypothetical protein QNH48_10190 [Neobacillus sp. YX16]